MTKNEISIVKKQFSIKHCESIQTMARCFVSAEGKILMNDVHNFAYFTEEEQEQYLKVFRQCYSGKTGKKLLSLDFLPDEESRETQETLFALRESKLGSSQLLEELYDTVVKTSDCMESYLICVVYGEEFIGGKEDDGTVFSFVQLAIAPFKLKQDPLTYSAPTKEIIDGARKLVIDGKTYASFLYPVLSENDADIHHVLFYSGNDKQFPERMISELLKSAIPVTAEQQKEYFSDLLSVSISNKEAGKIREIYRAVSERADCDNEEERRIDGEVIGDILAGEGFKEEDIAAVKENLKILEEEKGISTRFDAGNLVDKKTTVLMGEITIELPSGMPESVLTTRIVDGRKYIMIPVSDAVVVNDITCM